MSTKRLAHGVCMFSFLATKAKKALDDDAGACARKGNKMVLPMLQ